jgi:hypothetical protein
MLFKFVGNKLDLNSEDYHIIFVFVENMNYNRIKYTYLILKKCQNNKYTKNVLN